MRLPKTIVFLTALAALTACGRSTTKFSRGSASQEPGGKMCTMEARGSVSVTIHSDAWESGQSSAPYTVKVEGPDYQHQVSFNANGQVGSGGIASFDDDKGELNVSGGAYELAGDFTIRLLNSMNQEVDRKDVTVQSGDCHIIGEVVTFEIP